MKRNLNELRKVCKGENVKFLALKSIQKQGSKGIRQLPINLMIHKSTSSVDYILNLMNQPIKIQ